MTGVADARPPPAGRAAAGRRRSAAAVAAAWSSGAGPGGDQHVLDRRVGRSGRRRASARPGPDSPTAWSRVGLLAVAGHAADRRSRRDEHHPAARSRARVLRAPPRHPYHPARAPVRHWFVLPPAMCGVGVEPVGAGARSQERRPPVFEVGFTPPRSGGSRIGKVGADPYGGGRTREPGGGWRGDGRAGRVRAGAGRADHSGSAACADAATRRRRERDPARPRQGAALSRTDAWLTTVNILIGLWTGLLSFAVLALAAAGRAGADAGVPGRHSAAGVRVAGVAVVRRAGRAAATGWCSASTSRPRTRTRSPTAASPTGSARCCATPARWREAGYGLLRFPLSVGGGGARRCRLAAAARRASRCRSTTGRCRTAAPTSRCSRCELVVARAGVPAERAAADQRSADGALARRRRPGDRPPAARAATAGRAGRRAGAQPGRAWSTRPTPSAAGSSATCTTAPSSGWSRWR